MPKALATVRAVPYKYEKTIRYRLVFLLGDPSKVPFSENAKSKLDLIHLCNEYRLNLSNSASILNDYGQKMLLYE